MEEKELHEFFLKYLQDIMTERESRYNDRIASQEVKIEIVREKLHDIQISISNITGKFITKADHKELIGEIEKMKECLMKSVSETKGRKDLIGWVVGLIMLGISLLNTWLDHRIK